MKKIFLFITCFYMFYFSFGQTNSIEEAANKEYTILFIGNSLTFTNNLPLLVKKSAKKNGITIKSKTVAFPNYGIADHWKDGIVQKLIKANYYDFVIIQQGPSSQTDGRQMLIDYGQKYKDLCSDYNSKLCFFMVWPSKAYYQSFENVIKNHKDAAIINDALLLPVGEMWKNHFDKTSNFDYYGSDGFHPSLKGSQIAAEIIVEYLFINNN